MAKTYCEETHCQMFKHSKKLIKQKTISEVEQKIYELQLKYENQYGCTITEMYVEVVNDLLEWLQNQRGE